MTQALLGLVLGLAIGAACRWLWTFPSRRRSDWWVRCWSTLGFMAADLALLAEVPPARAQEQAH